MTTAVSLTLMALCLLLSAYFSATETAFSSLTAGRSWPCGSTASMTA